MQNTHDKPGVVIIGAGPAGMLLAYLLVANGVPVHVLERHSDFKREFRGEGIQPSVMHALEELGFLPQLLKMGVATPAHEAVIYMDDRPVVTLGGLGGMTDDFGLILFQEGFLDFLHQQCSAYPHYRLEMGFNVTDVVMDRGTVVGVRGRHDGQDTLIQGNFFVTTTGRNSALRKRVGLETETLETAFNIYWLRFDAPDDPALIPNGFRAYLGEDSVFIMYRTYDHRIQVAWGKRWGDSTAFRDIETLRDHLIREIPAQYRPMIVAQFSEDTERQLLKVACDRLERWHVPGMLFLGDAAHTMSPVAGQGINLAMRDSIVAANHLITAYRGHQPFDAALCQRIEEERRPEVEAMQSFQIMLGRLMLGAPRWQSRLVFHHLMPVLSLTGVRQRYIRRVQGGVTDVRLQYPVAMAPAVSHDLEPT